MRSPKKALIKLTLMSALFVGLGLPLRLTLAGAPESVGSEINLGMTDHLNVLILIGYMDQVGLSYIKPLPDLFYHNYNIALSEEIRLSLKDLFRDNELQALSRSSEMSVYNSRSISFQVLDVNVACTAELESLQKGLEFSKRLFLCKDQSSRLKKVQDYLKENLNRYDAFLYIGHSRNGRGLGIGPYLENYIFDPSIYNKNDLGHLKRIVFASCDGQKHYASKISSKVSVDFRGFIGAGYMIKDLLPFLLKEIQIIIDQGIAD